MTITKVVEDFIKRDQILPDGRYKSWEYCFDFFQHKFKQKNWDLASLMLAFYLASWGMYRGSSFLLQYTYTIHIEPLKIIFSQRYRILREKKILQDSEISLLFQLVNELQDFYLKKHHNIRPSIVSKDQVSETLISKILMGVLGNIPAYDRFVKAGLKKSKISHRMSPTSYNQLVNFYHKHYKEIKSLTKKYPYYPPMKLLDMYFLTLGQNIS